MQVRSLACCHQIVSPLEVVRDRSFITGGGTGSKMGGLRKIHDMRGAPLRVSTKNNVMTCAVIVYMGSRNNIHARRGSREIFRILRNVDPVPPCR